MTIGIDISPACRKQKTGIEWYAWHITKGLLAHPRNSMRYRLYADGMPDTSFLGADVRILKWPTRYFWSEMRLSAEMIISKPDVLFVPSRALPLVLPKKSVTTIHDVGFIPFPDERRRLSREYLLASSRRAAQHATHIITISEFSKGEIVRYLNTPPEKITVTHLGYDTEKYIPNGIEKKKPTILYIGRRERRKNLITLVRAYELLAEKMKGAVPDLVCVGPPGHHASEIDEAIAKSPLRASIHIRNWISEKEKIELLQSVLVVVQPSLYEGFGLPVIEAQACGAPVICSRAGALPEVAGDAAAFADAQEPDSFSEMLAKVITDTAYRDDLVARGLKNAARFSWDLTVQKTAEVFSKMSL